MRGETDAHRFTSHVSRSCVYLLSMTKLPVAILGATGTVGQKFIALLAEHPWFEIVQLAASAARDGKRYGDEVRWRELTPLPEHIAEMRLTTVAPMAGVRIAFSALDAPVAREVEPAFAAAGVFVVSNASAFRMADDVPLLIPEVNADHLALLARQRRERGWTGAIVVNPNCSTAALVTAIAPLHRAYGLRKAVVATLQAASGAGYPGVPSLDLLGNVIPLIGGEEEKIEAELRKILGRVEGERIVEARDRDQCDGAPRPRGRRAHGECVAGVRHRADADRGDRDAARLSRHRPGADAAEFAGTARRSGSTAPTGRSRGSTSTAAAG